jgi:hypothetical protein
MKQESKQSEQQALPSFIYFNTGTGRRCIASLYALCSSIAYIYREQQLVRTHELMSM